MSQEFRVTELPQGAKVVSISQRGKQSVSLGFWVKVGSRYEPARLSGVSHFIEHMLFKGTKKRSSRKIKEDIEGVGGLLNAFTSEESTCYFTKIMSSRLAQSLDVLADMFLDATLTEEDFRKEREVIIEEIKMYEDVPAQHVQDVIGELLWPDHPLGRRVSGTEKTLRAMSRSDMAEFKRRYYHPRNLIISAVGNVGHEELTASVKRIFKKVRAHASPGPKSAGKPGRSGLYRFLDKSAEQANFVIGVHGFSRYHPDRYKLALMNMILGGNMSSRLFEALREKKGLAYEVRSSSSFYYDAGSLCISAGAEPGKTVSAVRAIARELRRLVRTKVGAAELRRAKDYFVSQFLMSLEDSLEYMFWIGEAFIYRDRALTPEEICRRVETISSEDIRTVAQTLFQKRAFHLACIGPIKASEQAAIQKEIAGI